MRLPLKPVWQLPQNKPFDTGWNLIMLLLLLTFKLAARILCVMVYAGITVLTPSYMCISTLCKRIYQVYKHLYAKVIDIILAPQEQPSIQRMYKKLARIGKHLYKLRTLHNKLRNECTSGRNSRVKSTRPRSAVFPIPENPEDSAMHKIAGKAKTK